MSQSLIARRTAKTSISVAQGCRHEYASKGYQLVASHCPRWLHTDHSREIQAETRKDIGQAKSERHERTIKRKPPRSPAANASLRKVAFEAEQSRGRVNGGLHLEGRPESKSKDATKLVTAFCAAEQYNLQRIASILRASGYILDPFDTDLYPQVIHFQAPSANAPEPDEVNETSSKTVMGDVFIFPLGTVVAWDVDEERMQHLIGGALAHATINPHSGKYETEDLDYFEDPSSDKSSVVGDTIRIGTKPLFSTSSRRTDKEAPEPHDQIHDNTRGEAADGAASHMSSRLTTEEQHAHKQNVTLAKIAFSSGLARSTKIAFLESLLDNYFANTQRIPSLLSTGSRLPYNRAFMLRKAGELLHVRAQLNTTELTDKIPDLFWDSRHELGLEGYFDQIGKALDVRVRIKVLNERMDYAQEIATVLRENLSERHGLLLEWLIIGLIAVEVGVEGWKVWKELKASRDPNSTENLMHRWIEQQLAQTK